MLMVAIISWGKDLLIQPIDSMYSVKRLRRVLQGDRDFVLFDSVFHSPIQLDMGYRQLLEDEVIEFLKWSAFPELIEEGRMELKNGKAVYITKKLNGVK